MKNQIQNASEVKNSSRTRTLAHETRKNRQGLTMFVMTVANQGGTMEADTISKNKRSLKSQMSRMTKSSLFLICGLLFAASVNAQVWEVGDQRQRDNVRARLDNGTLTIRGTGGTMDCTDGYELWYQYRHIIREIIIEDGVTSIGKRLFDVANSIALTSITIGSSLTNVNNLPIHSSTLISIHVDNNNSFYSSVDGVLFNKAKTKLIKYPKGKKDAEYTIPNSVTEIEENAFVVCRVLTSVTIPYGVTEIGADAFYGCTGLISITIPNSVTYIGQSAFEGCKGLTFITISNNVTEIESSTFRGCTGLTAVTIPESVKKIMGFSLCTGLTSVTIPNGVTVIGAGAFSGCTGLKSVSIPNSVTEIGGGAFYGCTSLSSVIIPESVKKIEGGNNYNGAFKGCTGLTSVHFLDGWTTWDKGVFEGCTKLTRENIKLGK